MPVLFPTDQRLTTDDFKKLASPKLGAKLKEMHDKFIKEEERAKK